MLYNVVIATLAYGFVNAYRFALCKVVKIDENEAENGGDVCCCYFTD